jgi:iron complex outermembrane receptor protein
LSPLLAAGTFVLAALAGTPGTPGTPLDLVDERGAPVASATVDFTDASGAHDREATGPDGSVTARAGFTPVAADITEPGFQPLHVRLGELHAPRVTLARVLPVIGSVTVATGSTKSAHEAPLATSTLDAATIGLSPAVTTDRLLRQLPGFDRSRSSSAFTNYGLLRASFSGAGTDRGVVLVDGFPAQDGFGGQIDWQAYPSDEIERVELLRGSGSALYGSGAVGGVLGISTFAPQTGYGTVPDGRILLGAGSNEQADNALLVRTGIGSTVAASLVTVASQLAYADLPPGYNSPIDHIAKSSSGTEHLRLRYADGPTTIDGSFLASSDQQDEGRPNYNFERNLRQEDVAATERIGPALARFAYYVRDTTVYNNDDTYPPPASAPDTPDTLRYRQHVPSDENGFSGSTLLTAGTTELAFLVDQKRVDGRSEQYGPTGALTALGTGVQLSQGVGLQATFHAPRTEFLVGARADRVRYDDLDYTSTVMGTVVPHDVAGHDEGAISPRAALRYDLTPRVALRISSGGGFRAPYLNELVRGFNVGQTVMSPNPNLVPERSRTDVAGIDALLGTGRLSFDITETHVSDAIAFLTVAGATPPRAVRENLDKTQTDGETLSYAQPVGTCTRIRVSGTTQNARVTSGPAADIGKALTLVPSRTATVGVDGGSRGPLSYSIDGSYIGQTYYDDLNTEPLGAALLFGATVRATTASGTSFAISGDNLTHQTYLANIDRYGEPLTVSLRIAIPFGRNVRRVASSCTF